LFFFVIFVAKIIKGNNINVYEFVIPGELGSYGVLHLSENYHTSPETSPVYVVFYNCIQLEPIFVIFGTQYREKHSFQTYV